MKLTYWISLFIADLLADLFAVYTDNETLRYFTKPFLILLLIVLFISQTKAISSPLKKWTLLALLFSWTGDVLLMFESKNSNFFMFGLVAFLLAHIFYIILFTLIRKKENVSSKDGLIVLVGCYGVLLMDILTPYLGNMKWPVRIYALVLVLMLYAALLMGFVKKYGFGILIVVGAILFVLSDSLLAINKFYNSFEYAGIAIMITYGLAQLLITFGAIRYITSTPKQ